MRAISVLLLLLLGLALSPGAATVCGAAFESNPKESPWNEGEVIKAEFVWSAPLRGGYIEKTFVTPDGKGVNIVPDPGENCLEAGDCEDMTPEEAIERPDRKAEAGIDILDDAWLGRQMLLTFKRLNWKGRTNEGCVLYGITASRVRLDRAPDAPRNTRIIPNQELREKIFCPDAMEAGGVYLRSEDKKWYRLTPRWNGELPSFLLFCKVRKTVILEGDLEPEDEEPFLFQTHTPLRNFFLIGRIMEAVHARDIGGAVGFGAEFRGCDCRGGRGGEGNRDVPLEGRRSDQGRVRVVGVDTGGIR